MRVAITALFGMFLLTTSVSGQRLSTDSSSSKSKTVTSVSGKTLAQWKLDLKSSDASKRSMAIVAIVQFDETSTAECVPLLVERLRDTDVSPRAKALAALSMVRVEAKDIDGVVRAIAARIDPQFEPQAVVRLEAIRALATFQANAEPAIPALIKATNDRASWEIRHLSVALLWRIGAEMNKDSSGTDPRIAEALLALLRNDKTHKVRLEVLLGLGAMGRPDNPALTQKIVSELTLCASHKNTALALWAYVGLVAMQDGMAAEASLQKVARFARNEDIEIRTQALAALGALGKKAKSQQSVFLTALKDPEPVIVRAACDGLALMGDRNTAIIDALLEVAQSKEPHRAAGAVIALIQLKADSSKVMNTFDKMRENKDLDIDLRKLIEQGQKELKKK